MATKSKKTRTRANRRRAVKPRVAVRFNSKLHLCSKRPHQKRHYTPLTPEQQKGYQSADPEILEDTLWKCDEIDLDTPQKHRMKRGWKYFSRKKRRKACHAFCTAPHIFQDQKSAWLITLLALLASVMDMALQDLPKTPVAYLKGVSFLPEALHVLLQAVHGPDRLKAKRNHLKCPTYVHAEVPLGMATPSLDMEDYFGGRAKVHGESVHFWVPPCNTALAIAANTPAAIQKEISSHSPFIIPVYCGTMPKMPDKIVFDMDGIVFHVVEPDKLNGLTKRRYPISLMLGTYSSWLHKKAKRWRRCIRDAVNFYPKTESGRFVVTTATDEERIRAIALANFKGFLNFAVKEKWVTLKEANGFLDEAWQQVLPESFPKALAGTTNTPGGSWDTPDVFWDFLGCYLKEKQKAISLNGAPCKRGTIAAVHKLPDGEYLILSRELVAQAYAVYLGQHGIAPLVEEKSWEISLQRAILDWGIQIKREKKDITWRFAFYEKDASSLAKSKVPCLAFPLVQLPASIANGLLEWFGETFGRWLQPQADRNAAEPEKVAYQIKK